MLEGLGRLVIRSRKFTPFFDFFAAVDEDPFPMGRMTRPQASRHLARRLPSGREHLSATVARCLPACALERVSR